MNRTNSRRFLVVGDSAAARRLYESFQQVAHPRHVWCGVVADSAPNADLGDWQGPSDAIVEIVSRLRPTDLIVARNQLDLLLAKHLLRLAEGGLQIVDACALEEELTERVSLLGRDDIWATTLRGLRARGHGSRIFKRLLDVVAALCAIAALAIAIGPVALALKLERAGSVFVREQRVGRFGRRFSVLRLRTFRNTAGRRRWPFDDPAPRLLSGEIIRLLGLQRLPLAFAILSGQLSLVGPRALEPEAMRQLERESSVHLLRTTITPGLVGWEQLHFESRSVYDALRPLEYDLYYIKHQSFKLDVRILARIALRMLRMNRLASG